MKTLLSPAIALVFAFAPALATFDNPDRELLSWSHLADGVIFAAYSDQTAEITEFDWKTYTIGKVLHSISAELRQIGRASCRERV